MTLQEAIEIKGIYHNCHSQSMTPDERLADNLSIEALKQIQRERTLGNITVDKLLPGETED